MQRYFRFVTAHPLPVLICCGLLALATGAFMLRLTRDTSPDAFIPPHHPALQLKRDVDARFHLREPIAVGIFRDAEGGIFVPDTLRLIRDLTRDIMQLAGVQPDEVISLATESGVYFDDNNEPGFELLMPDIPTDPAVLADLRDDILGYELYRGTLVAADASAAAIIIRPADEQLAGRIYAEIAALLRDYPTHGERLVVAGEAAVREYMGLAVSDDALRMNFICPVVMMLLILLAYRTLRGTVLPMCVVGGGGAMAMGLMAAAGVPVYIVTNGIFVVIMALGVADSLHLLGQYYEEQLAPAGRSRNQIIVDACSTLWFPVLVTSLTDLTGFLSLYLGGEMPPIRWFGLFTCAGVLGCLIFTYALLPAGLAILPLRRSPVFTQRVTSPDGHVAALDSIGRALGSLGTITYCRPVAVLICGALVLATAALAANRLTVNDARILAFRDDHPLVVATRALNEHFDGTTQLNVVVTADRPGEFTQPDALHRIEDLEAFTETLPHVGGTHSIVGWVRRAHQKMHDEDEAYYAIPDDPAETRFYLDVLSAETSPMSALLAEVVDRDYSAVNLIVRLRSSEYVHERAVVDALEAYLAEHFSTGPLRAELSGRVHLDYHWLRLILKSHLRSAGLSAAAVLLLTGLMFRSFVAGTLCTLVVAAAILINYALMGLLGIPLGVGTSMFASIAIGAGVNFPIHMLERIRVALRRPGADPAAVFRDACAFTGRALFFTTFVLAVGFGLLLVSQFRTLSEFGLLVGASITSCFVVSLTLLPAALAALRPRFIFPHPPIPPATAQASPVPGARSDSQSPT